MLKKLLITTENLRSQKKITLLFFLAFYTIYAQEIPDSFKEKAERLVSMRPKTYLNMDTEFQKEKSDTTLLRYNAKK